MSLSNNFPNIKPSLLLSFANTKQLDPRITFSRASTATYYDGKTTAKAEENLALYSQDFDNAQWTKSQCAITANTVAAPDGTTTAETMTASAGSVSPWFGYNSSSVAASRTVTLSIYAKKNTNDFFQVFLWNTAGYANFNLATGVIGSADAGVTNQTITSIGNGWYRCSFTYTTSTGSLMIGAALVGSATATRLQAFTAAGTESVYVWGAQFEDRSSVTAYTPTTSQPITNYIPVLLTAASGVARFDNNPTTGESLGLLIEEQRTNLLTYSSEFDNAAWTKTASTVTANTVVAPDGTLTGDKLVADTSAATHLLTETISVLASTTYTFSCYIKAGEYGYAGVGFQGNGVFVSGVQAIVVNLSTGAVTVGAGSPTGVAVNAGNGWWRVAITATGGTGTATANPYVYVINGTTYADRIIAGNGYSGIYIWGAQLEAGAFATSYIATTSAQVTRAADTASMTGTNFSSWYNNSEGTLYADFSSLSPLTAGQSIALGKYPRVWEISGNAATTIYWYGVNADLYVGGTYNNLGTVPQTNKLGVALSSSSAGNNASSLNGGAASSKSGSIANASSTVLRIGVDSNGLNQLNGTIKKIAYYAARVTNTQLQALTS